MNELIFSRQQFDALISRLDEIRKIVAVIKLKTTPTEACMEAHDVMLKFKISKRTLERWRQTGRVPYHKVGNFFYFNTEDILGQVASKAVRPAKVVGDDSALPGMGVRERHRRALLNRFFVGLNGVRPGGQFVRRRLLNVPPREPP